MLEVEYDTNDADVVAWAVAFHAASAPFAHTLRWVRLLVVVSSVLAGIGLAIAVLGVVADAVEASAGLWLVAVALPAAAAVGTCVALLPRVDPYLRRQVARRAAEARAGGGATPARLRVGPYGLEAEQGGIRSTAPWASVIGIIDTPSHLFLDLGEGRAVIVPKRALSDRELTQVEAVVRRRIAPKT